MSDNGPDRLHEVFFYGLYMNPAILREKGVEPRQPRKATLADYALRIADRATLLRTPGALTHGMLYALTHAEIDTLYAGAGLDAYRAEAVLVQTDNGAVAALCCNLLQPPGEDESNPEYTQRLRQTLKELGLPANV